MTVANPTPTEEPENVRNIQSFNLIRTGHLHMADWSLINTALENLVISLEMSEGRMEGNLIERAEGLRANIQRMILEDDE